MFTRLQYTIINCKAIALLSCMITLDTTSFPDHIHPAYTPSPIPSVGYLHAQHSLTLLRVTAYFSYFPSIFLLANRVPGLPTFTLFLLVSPVCYTHLLCGCTCPGKSAERHACYCYHSQDIAGSVTSHKVILTVQHQLLCPSMTF